MAEQGCTLEMECVDQAFYAPRFGVELVRECTHEAITETLAPPRQQAMASGLGALHLRACCSSCYREVDVRLWLPEAGQWYLGVQERLAAGRAWIFRWTGDTWAADIYA